MSKRRKLDSCTSTSSTTLISRRARLQNSFHLSHICTDRRYRLKCVDWIYLTFSTVLTISLYVVSGPFNSSEVPIDRVETKNIQMLCYHAVINIESRTVAQKIQWQDPFCLIGLNGLFLKKKVSKIHLPVSPFNKVNPHWRNKITTNIHLTSGMNEASFIE